MRDLSIHEMGILRCLFRYRTILITNSITGVDPRLKHIWEEAFKYYPEWIGFDDLLCRPNIDLAVFYKRQLSEKCYEELDE